VSRIVDRRTQGKSPSAGNRKKFIDRNKKYVKEAIDRTIERTKIKDIQNKRKVTIPADTLDEPTFTHSDDKGIRRVVRSGNRRFVKGDLVDKPQGGGQGGRASDDPTKGQDDFQFELTKEEFLDILFEDMALPNYVKESIKKDFKTKRVRAGYSPDGAISQLNLKKTFEKSLARRIAAKGSLEARVAAAETEEEKERERNRKPPFLEEVDMRFNHYAQRKYPARHAVMFCLMDVSGSMSDHHKDLAKRFFLLLYLFLERQYDSIDIRFIRHTTTAEEVDEETFFYDRETGGTLVSTVFHKMMEIVGKEYDTDKTNIYVAQASDGDNWESDNNELVNVIEHRVLPVVQYMAYLEVLKPSTNAKHLMNMAGYEWLTLSGLYEPLVKKYSHFNQAMVDEKDQVFGALRGLFTDE